MKKRLLGCLLALLVLAGAALAEPISFSGKVETAAEVPVYAAIGGTVEQVHVTAGRKVAAGDVLATLKTEKVYATEDGTVMAVYGQPGDDAETVAGTFGAVMYIEGDTFYTVSATTGKAYNEKDNYRIHPGETVYLLSTSHAADKGEGVVTSVSGSSFTIRVNGGDFYLSDSMYIFRDPAMNAESRIGRGSLSRVDPVAVTGTGSIVSYAVNPGDRVTRGQLLFETLSGTFDGLAMEGADIKAPVAGTVAELNINAGDNVSEGAVAAVIWPDGEMRVTAEVPETDLSQLNVGDKVKVELDWNLDQGVSYEGTVEMISTLGTVGDESTTYTVYIRFTPDENTRYNMTAMVSTPEDEAADEAGPEANAEPAEVTEEKPAVPEVPEGMPEMPEGMELPEGMTPPDTDGTFTPPAQP